MAKRSKIIAGLDIGTTKVLVVVGKVDEEGELEIVGIGNSSSPGLKKGAIIDLKETVVSISQALGDAERTSDSAINTIYTNIGGNQIKGVNSRGVVAIANQNREITESDIERVIEHAKTISIPAEREVIHILPREFIVDNQNGIKNPIGLSGMKLEVEVYIITATASLVKNLEKSINQAGYNIEQFVLQILADSYAVLTADEKELGVVLVNLGGGMTELATFIEGSLSHLDFIEIGGNYITNDIAIGLRTPKKEAERIKKEAGCAQVSRVKEEETIEITKIKNQEKQVISRKRLVEIIEPRVKEICNLIKDKICQSGLRKRVGSGIVLTGGSAEMEGFSSVAEEIIDLPVRIGIPNKVKGLVNLVNRPLYTTGVGLLLYGLEHQKKDFVVRRKKNIFSKTWHRIEEWWQELF